ncbi:MAG: phosphotransferase [Planctomycetota bacterium]
MNSQSESAAGSDWGAATPFGATLEPALREACGGRLSRVNWFRTAWQRGGAVTGYATFTAGDGAEHRVVVKLPVPPRERRWLKALQGVGDGDDEAVHAGGIPRVWADGASLGGYDLAWVVMERIGHGPMDHRWGGREFDGVVDAAGRFYAGAAAVAIDPSSEARRRDWSAMLAAGRERVKARGASQPQRWKAALKRASRRLDGWVERWAERGAEDWCHGDLHLGNCLCRSSPEDADGLPGAGGPGDAVLIDLAEVRVGHWVEDAVYLEQQFWSSPHRLGGRKLVSLLARERKARGLRVGEGWPELAKVKRALLAMATATRFHEVSHAHADAALGVLEREVG